jgi:hypothetical protein
VLDQVERWADVLPKLVEINLRLVVDPPGT